jgi:multicomponent Na+:H+ antiporter subunit B
VKRLALILVLLIGLLLAWATQDFPRWGDPHSPASSSSVSSHFIANTGVDTEVPNMVTAVLADYRGFDTMLETVVVFIAGIAVFSILKGGPKQRTRDREFVVDFEPDLIVTNTVRLIVPVIQIFAFYVLAHGHVSPGGGFQGGVAMGASFILVALAWDLKTALLRFSIDRCFMVAALGIVIYAGIGFLSMFLGGEFLDYAHLAAVLPVSHEMARYHAMLGVEIGVGFTVTAIIFALYASLSTDGRMRDGL